MFHRFGEIHKAKESDLNELRKKIDDKLKRFAGRIVVVIDDIDRLRPDEVRLIFRLVKAVADFPRIIYLVAYDEPIVAKTLGDGDLKAGREYLHKIVQLTLTIPTPDQSALQQWFRGDLADILEGTPERLLNCAETMDRLWPFVDQFLLTPRDVVRFLNLLRATYPMVRGEVNALHFVFIQALRQFTPSLHRFVANNGDRLHKLDGNNETQKQDLEQGISQALGIDLSADHTIVTEAAQEILRRLFDGVRVMYPSTMADNCSIGRAEYFPRYFLLGVPSGTLSEAERDNTMSLISDVVAFESKLKELASPVRYNGGSRLRDFLSRLCWDDRVHCPVDNVEFVLRAFYAVGDELLSEAPLADSSDPERLAFAGEMLDVARAVLSRKMTQSERRALLVSIFGEAKALFTMSNHVSEFSKQHEQYAILGAEDLDTLKGVVVESFRKGARDGSLRRVPFLTCVLARYSEWADEAEVQEYRQSLIKTDDGLCDYLVGSTFNGELDESSVQAVLADNRDNVVHRCKNILRTRPAWLTERHRVALESFSEWLAVRTAPPG